MDYRVLHKWNLDRGEAVDVQYNSGRHMDVESAVRILLPTVRGYRVPEPTRRAHLYVNDLRMRQRHIH